MVNQRREVRCVYDKVRTEIVSRSTVNRCMVGGSATKRARMKKDRYIINRSSTM